MEKINMFTGLLVLLAMISSLEAMSLGPDLHQDLIRHTRHGRMSPLERLYNGIQLNDLVSVQIALDQGANPNEARPNYINSYFALLEAVKMGNHQIVETLLNANANPDTQDASGNTPLMLAAKNYKNELVDLLIQHHANLNLQNNAGDTALHMAATPPLKPNPLFDQIMSVRQEDPLLEQRQITTLNLLLTANANLNKQNSNGHTPLHSATPSLASTKLILEKKTPLNVQDNYQGYTPLHKAIHEGNIKVAEALLIKGADPNIPNNTGQAPLHTAAQFADSEGVKVLLEAKANPNLKNEKGKTPLLVASKVDTRTDWRLIQPKIAIIKMLIIAESKILEAIKNNSSEFEIRKLMRKLEDYKIPPAEIRDKNGNNILHYVVRYLPADSRAKRLIAAYPSLAALHNKPLDGSSPQTPVQWALGSAPMMELLVKAAHSTPINNPEIPREQKTKVNRGLMQKIYELFFGNK